MWRRKGRGGKGGSGAGDTGAGGPRAGGDGARGWLAPDGVRRGWLAPDGLRRGWRRLRALSWRGVPTEETPAWPHGTPGHHCRFEDADLPAFLARLPAWFEDGTPDSPGFDAAAAAALAADALALPVGGALARRYAVRRDGRAMALDLRARRFVAGEVDLHVPGPAELCERLEEEVDRFFDEVGY